MRSKNKDVAVRNLKQITTYILEIIVIKMSDKQIRMFERKENLLIIFNQNSQ